MHASKRDSWFELQGMQWMHYGRKVYQRINTTLSISFPFPSHILLASSFKPLKESAT